MPHEACASSMTTRAALSCTPGARGRREHEDVEGEGEARVHAARHLALQVAVRHSLDVPILCPGTAQLAEAVVGRATGGPTLMFWRKMCISAETFAAMFSWLCAHEHFRGADDTHALGRAAWK